MSKKILSSALVLSPEITLFHTGPSFAHGPLPSVFYFALSGEDSLDTDPYNQFVQFLADYQIRVFSLTLPGHEEGIPPSQALDLWARDIREGKDPFSPFFDKVEESFRYLVSQNIIEEDKVAVAGLSRGGFMAAHLAARIPAFKHILCFAPLLELNRVKEFHSLKDHPLVANYHLDTVADKLCAHNIRIYIGNRDIRVGTKASFELVEKLVDLAFEKKIRTAPIELILTPSIGHQGHGTPPETFKAGADWIIESLHVS
ncbi:MAG TPA: prolyl oligopeptidase family serine peptidase [Chlamydiales bacterium]|nr:prolyl oligopeptidase family serine peptidase [Chlamydiales bacterium]